MSGVPKLLLIYAVAIPLAIVLGFLISAPGMGSLVIIGLLLFLFLVPFLLSHHHFLLILFWNSAFNVFFLPAQPHFWLLLAFLSLGISWLNNIMGEKNFLKAPEIAWPMLAFGTVVLLTMFARGGLGARFMGGASYGGKGYVYILGAIVGYFALTAMRIPLQRRESWSGWFFLSGVSFGLSNLVFILGPAFYVLYLLVPPEYAISQAFSEAGETDIMRIQGMPTLCTAVICFLLVRYGMRGVLDWRRPWICLLVVAMLIGAGLGGFRSAYVMLALIFALQFYFEGLHRTVLLAVFVACGIAGVVFLEIFANQLPLSVQRSISFLPIKVDSSVALDADFSAQWRLDMWRIVAADIPQYLVLGKGYRIDADELYLSDIATQMGMDKDFEGSRLTGDYHNGPLSVLMTFGVLGMVSFLWVIWAGAKCLYRAYRHGDPALRVINTFFLAFFLAHALFFLTIYGDIRYDLFIFTGTLGMSVTINGGVARKRSRAPRVSAAVAELQPQMA